MELKHPYHDHPKRITTRIAFYAFGFISLLWLLIRSGSKPSRLAYPCQRAAASYSLNFLLSFSSLFGAIVLSKRLNCFPVRNLFDDKNWTLRIRFLKLGLLFSTFLLIPISGSSNAISPMVLKIPNLSIEERTINLPAYLNLFPTVALTHLDHIPSEAEIALMVDQSINGALGPGGLMNLVKDGDTVLIKPNLGCGYNAYETTDWRVVKPIVQLAKQAGASQVMIGEGEGCNYGDSIFDLSGYTVHIPDVTYINFNNTISNPYYNVSVINGLWNQAIAIPQAYFDADVIISVPKLKTHSEGGVTLSLKNAVGVPPVSVYSRLGKSYRTLLHDNFEIRKSIVQINLAKQPDFALIDGLLAGQGEGPWAANPIEMDVVLASKDLVALDAVGTAIMGIDPMRIPYLTYANEKNLGTLDLGSIRIVGATIADIEKKFELPAKAPYIYRKAIIVHKTAGPISVDGSLADWNLVRPIRLDKKSDVVLGENEWGGPLDLNLKSRFVYDHDAFYVIVEVRDDQIIHNTAPDQTPPLGDTLELVVSVVDPWFRLQDPAYGKSDFRFRVGYSPTPVLWDLN